MGERTAVRQRSPRRRAGACTGAYFLPPVRHDRVLDLMQLRAAQPAQHAWRDQLVPDREPPDFNPDLPF